MKLTSILIIALATQATQSLAQAQDSTKTNRRVVTETVKGTILDKNTRLPIIGATIVLSSNGNTKSVSTDQQGEFRLLQVPVGRQVLQIRMAGYRQEELSELLITSGRENVLNIEMEPQANTLNEAVVYANTGKQPLNQMAMTSGRSFSPEETNRYAGAFLTPQEWHRVFPESLLEVMTMR
ncbi:carboxypeptidase-like regulatory domain-containing protein [Sphingobacterium sp. E70]|uniref:carboxypeptidase-like regulatory domain-containing protein n=1 Tax=Sphingobacterium sp. E70 TaxID=2853439 RepID=UPI00211C3DEE|nr:carboxypeptidase-like regulatory domain-containing protein [Sphingobacterium sp. E70]ULT27615.1 carboxypeptidase-like regulatory domain-containing protein [Sphingobacterium sp. E70]